MTDQIKTSKEIIAELEERITKLEALVQPRRNEATREMTVADAERILTGDLKDASHKDAASTLGLSYGQIYSCRLEFTFKAVHKAMKSAGQTNRWAK
jgi:hypothetical protein